MVKNISGVPVDLPKQLTYKNPNSKAIKRENEPSSVIK